jgi:hypothetical protein
MTKSGIVDLALDYLVDKRIDQDRPCPFSWKHIWEAKDVLQEFLWFRFGHFKGYTFIPKCYSSWEELKRDIDDHPFLFDCGRAIHHNSYDLGELYHGVNLCVMASRLTPRCKSSFNGLYVAFTLDHLVKQKDVIHFYGTVDGQEAHFRDVDGAFFSKTHIQLAICFSKFWRKQRLDEYQKMIECLQSPEMTPLTMSQYFDVHVFTVIIRQYLYFG